MIKRNRADADGADRIAVVSLFHRYERMLPAHTAVMPVLESHFKRNLDAGRSGIGIKNFRQSRRRDFRQLRRQLDGRHIGHAKKRGMGDAAKLLLDRPVQFRDIVPVHI
ncbi:Uncharacterised protein [Mycobacterium tuberculosis]|nr:Uncharacterised protein [Mycobacterium tuberculosis]